MQAHQQRVVDEKSELDAKYAKLNDFINSNPMFATVSPQEQALLRNQLNIMGQYSGILWQRIQLFTPQATPQQ